MSTRLAMGRGWEPELVSKVMEAMALHPEAVFLDLGSNIGAYTLPVASMRRRVVAVDMMRDNLAYIKTSLSQAGLDTYVEMVNNAVRSMKSVGEAASSGMGGDNQPQQQTVGQP